MGHMQDLQRRLKEALSRQEGARLGFTLTPECWAKYEEISHEVLGLERMLAAVVGGGSGDFGVWGDSGGDDERVSGAPGGRVSGGKLKAQRQRVKIKGKDKGEGEKQ
jgi:hypothetical protein